MDAMVVEAPPVKDMSEVVADCPAAGCVNASYVRSPVASVPHERTPATEAFTSQLAVLSDETMMLVVDAVVALIIVVDANGIESPVPAGAAKLMVSALPTSAPAPESEIAVPAIGDEVATD